MRKEENSEKLLYSDSLLKVQLLSAADMTSLLAKSNRRLGAYLRKEKLHLVTAESLTAGSLSGYIADISGASDYLSGAFVCYTNQAKQTLLGIPAPMLEKYSAVSAPVVQSMAKNSLKRLPQADIAVALSGYAGPQTANWQEKEACGTVYFALALPLQLIDQSIKQVTCAATDCIACAYGDDVAVFTYKKIFSPKRNLVRLAACLFAIRELSAILAI